MKFDTPATTNPIDQLKVIGKAHDRIDGPKKTTGTAPYAYERHDVVANQAYGYVIGAGIAKGRITAMDTRVARSAPGVLAVVTAETAGPLGKGKFNTAKLLGGPEIEHYHQAIALVVAETFEQAGAAAALVTVDYARTEGSYDLAAVRTSGTLPPDVKDVVVGDFTSAFATAPVQVDATYTTPDQTHAMMEPHASMAVWRGDQLVVWTANQMIDLSLDTRTTLLDTLREHLQLTGSKGCDHGQCGACTVILDGHRINSCLTLAMHQGSKITTIEGLGTPDYLHPMRPSCVDVEGDRHEHGCSLSIPSALACAEPMPGTAAVAIAVAPAAKAWRRVTPFSSR